MFKILFRPFYLIMLALLAATVTISLFHFMKALQNESAMAAPLGERDENPHLILISQELDNPYWRQVERGARSAAEKHGATLEYVGPVQANMT